PGHTNGNGNGHAPNAPIGLLAGVVAGRRVVHDDARIELILVSMRDRAAIGDPDSAKVVRALEGLARNKEVLNGSAHKTRGVLGVLEGRPLDECAVETGFPNLSV